MTTAPDFINSQNAQGSKDWIRPEERLKKKRNRFFSNY